LVVGIAALFLSWMPFVCLVSLVGAGIGLVFGFAGVLTSLIQKRFLGLGLSLAGGAVNLLALLVALVVTILSGGLFGSMRVDALSEPTAGVTLPEWGQVFDPDGDCTVEEKGPTLNIRVPPTAHDLSAELGRVNAPRVLREVEGDFVAQVKVCGAIHPVANAAVPGRVSFQSAGLLLWENPRSYIRLERAALNRDGPVQTYASLEMRSHAWPWAAEPVGLLEQDTYLRLERRGDQILGSVSEDGKQWTPLQPLHASLPSKVRIGVAAVNAAQQPLQVRFEDFKIEKK
jgi:regulation of enolase protein 1 (concanavalin A-like superfamily)